jgi:hypothetical protein
MKLAGYSNGNHPTKGSFSDADAGSIILDFTQGAHGRAFCGASTYDLPDPRVQQVQVSLPEGTLEITSGHGAPAQLGMVEVKTLKVQGDITLPVLRAERLEMVHSSIAANELTGHQNASDPEMEADRVLEITMRDSLLSCKGDLCFMNLEGDERSQSTVKAPYIEGFVTHGRLILQAERLAVGALDALEVRVGSPDGCRVGRNFCNRIFQQSGIETPTRIYAVRDRDLELAMQHTVNLDEIKGADLAVDVQGGIEIS